MEQKNIWQYFLTGVTKNYFNFTGRARRKEYWGFLLTSTVILILAAILDAFLLAWGVSNPDWIKITLILNLVLFLPSMTIGVRRFHDIGKRGWFPVVNSVLSLIFLLSQTYLTHTFFTPQQSGPLGIARRFGSSVLPISMGSIFVVVYLISTLILIIFALYNGVSGPNQYGPDPKKTSLGYEIDLIGKE